VGQTLEHGGSGQARHTTTANPLRMPPADLTHMLDFARPPIPGRRAQANMQDWHPTQRSESIIDNRFTILIP
jgi:hypothetical protein